MSVDRQRSADCRTGSGRPKTARTVDARFLWFATRSTFSAVRTVFSLLLHMYQF